MLLPGLTLKQLKFGPQLGNKDSTPTCWNFDGKPAQLRPDWPPWALVLAQLPLRPMHSMGDTAISKYTLHQSPPDKHSWIEIHGFQQEKQHILHMVEFSLLCWLFLSVFVLHLPSWMTITKTPAQCHPRVRQLKVIYCAWVVQSQESQAPKTGALILIN